MQQFCFAACSAPAREPAEESQDSVEEEVSELSESRRFPPKAFFAGAGFCSQAPRFAGPNFCSQPPRKESEVRPATRGRSGLRDRAVSPTVGRASGGGPRARPPACVSLVEPTFDESLASNLRSASTPSQPRLAAPQPTLPTEPLPNSPEACPRVCRSRSLTSMAARIVSKSLGADVVGVPQQQLVAQISTPSRSPNSASPGSTSSPAPTPRSEVTSFSGLGKSPFAGAKRKLLHERAKKIQAFWRRRSSNSLNDVTTVAAASPTTVSTARAASAPPSALSPEEAPDDEGDDMSAAAMVIQNSWRRRHAAGRVSRGESCLWARFGGCTASDVLPLPDSSSHTTEEEAKERCRSMPECMGFTLDASQSPPSVVYHGTIRPQDCAPGRSGRQGPCKSLVVHTRRFEKAHGCCPGMLPAAGEPLLLPIRRIPSFHDSVARWFPAEGQTPVAQAWDSAAAKIQSIWRKQRSQGGSPSRKSGGASHSTTELPSSSISGYFGWGRAGSSERDYWGETSRWFESKRQTLAANLTPANAMSQGLLQEWWQDRKRLAMESLMRSGAPMLKRTLGDLGAVITQNATADPDMPECLRPLIRSLVSNLWEDVETEIEAGLKVAVYQKPESSEKPCDSHDPALASGRCRGLLLRLRAFVLSHYLPFNRSIFGRFKDPVYLFLTLTTMLPIFGIRVFFFTMILIMLLFPGPPDEFQLINFILIFKGTQFFTSGVGGCFFGAMEYYACTLFTDTDLRGCITRHGPGATDYLSSLCMDYVGSMCLVWIAYLALPYSRTAWHKDHCLEGTRKEQVEEVYCCCLRGVVRRGGRLQSLLRHDVRCFIFSFAVFLPVYCFAGNDALSREAKVASFAHAKQTLFWSRVLYSLLSLPFVLFVIPGLGKVLTHTPATGYNAAGACVEFEYEKKAPRQEGEEHQKAV